MPTDIRASGLADLLRGLVAEFQAASGADIVSLFLYDSETRRYYAPFALGQPEESLLDSLADMQGQLARFLDDQAQNKVPDELRVAHYGSTVWLTMTRQVLRAYDAPAEIDSTFIRRHQVESTVALPLLAADALVGLVYLNYRASQDGKKGLRAPSGERLTKLEEKAAQAAREIQLVLAQAERKALEGIGRVTTQLLPLSEPQATDEGVVRRQVSIALAELMLATGLDAGLVYELARGHNMLELLTAHAPAAAPPRIKLPDDTKSWEETVTQAVTSQMRGVGLIRRPCIPSAPERSPAATCRS